MKQINVLKFIDGWLGRLLAETLPRPKVFIGTPSGLKRILLIRPGGIGDAVLVVPAIKRLNQMFPDATIDVLAEKRNADVFQLTNTVRKVFLYDLPQTFCGLRKEKYDLIIDTEQWYRLSAVYSWLMRAPVSIGFGTNERKRLFTHQVEYSMDDYELKSFLSLLGPLQCENSVPDSKVPFLEVPTDTMTAVNAKAESVLPSRYASIFPGGSVPEKRWPSERFVKLVEYLKTNGIESVLIGGVDEENTSLEISAATSCVSLVGKTSLLETAAVIEKSLLLVSGDSGVLHIAAGLGVPTVSMFGPSSSRKWAPRGSRHRVVSRELSCAPCSTFGNVPECHDGGVCLQGISPAEMIAAISPLLELVADFDMKESSDNGC